ncbi:MAG: type VI secretion system tube protein Hcp [Mucilaginibacter polytrichastri]|nr:type VI secretion system tube protein Hcp [Mucilaginibacter polytrichastri]
MALTAYMTLKGSKSGDIKGDVIQKGREGQIAVYAAHQATTIPTDPASGMATGRRRHTPLIVTKEIDRSSAPMHTLVNTNELIKEVVVYFYGVPKTGSGAQMGVEAVVYTIKLTNARIVSITTEMENNRLDPGKTLPILETIHFSFETIEWTWLNGGLTSVDTVTVI